MKLSKLTIAATAALTLTMTAPDLFAQVSSAGTVPTIANGSMQSTPTIESIDQALTDGRTVIRVRMSAPLSGRVSSFMASSPSRLAVDLPSRVEVAGPTLTEFSSGFAKTVGVVQSNGKSRIVIALRENVSYQTETIGSDLMITLRNIDLSKATADSRKPFSEGDSTSSHALSAFDFRRGPSGEGRVIVDLQDASTGIDIKQQGAKLFVDFVNASVPAALMKNMNVSDFGTLVNNVSISKGPRGTRMAIDARGDWEYNAYQADKRFVIEIKKKTDQSRSEGSGALAAGEEKNYTGEKMSMNFQNVDVRNLLNVIADFTKLNIVTSDAVQGNLTVRLENVPWDQALDIVLTTRGLDMRRNGSVIWVAPRDEINKLEKQVLEAQASLVELEATRTEAFQLNYSRAADVAALLNNPAQKILSKRGSVVIDARTNQMFVQDTVSKLEEVTGIIKKVDIAVRQVQIEARIVEARDSFGRSLGARLGFFNARPGQLLGQNTLFGATPTQYIDEMLAQPGTILNNPTGTAFRGYTPTPQVNLPAAGLGSGATPASFALTLFNSAASQFLNLELSAAEADGRGKIISSPRVVTGNQEKALIEQGTELPYQQASASGATNVAFKKANLKLEVTPQITPDGNVIMAVDINKDAPGANTSAGFAIDTKHVQTKVLIENGGTVVIGGIYTQDERTDVDKVPFLGDLPAIGNLFRTSVRRDSKTELLIFLTPRIMDDKLNTPK